jgi:hypothetical protein
MKSSSPAPPQPFPTPWYLVLALLWPLWPSCSPAAAATANDYAQQLIQQARQHRLSQDPQWQRLLHYRPRLFGAGVKSEADDPDFFASPNGKYDPEAELAATLQTFFSPRPWRKKKEPAQCAFIARYEWLDSRLHFDPRRLPRLPCEEFERWYAGINPGSLTLVFPSAYINNPSSMFGHTLLRVDTPGQREGTRLLSYVINYGAETGTDNGIAFAVKGIFGGYPGYVGIGPYYTKVKEYSDTESRDIWEYQLDFTPAELRRLLAHVWELRGVYFEYYFFDENCSYLVLTLLDVARPSLDLGSRLRGWVIPSDTLRLVSAQPQLVKRVVYRPAAGTKLAHLAASLSPAAQGTAQALAEGRLTVAAFAAEPYPAAERANILLLAHDDLRYEFLAHHRQRASAAELSRQLLLARSAIADAPPPPKVPTPAVRPEQGHNTAMLQAGAGKENGESFLQLDLRPAYHDLLDDDGGYVPGAQIDFLNLGLRYQRQPQRLTLEHFTLVDIISVSPRSRFFHPISWHVQTGWQRRILPGERSPRRPSYALDAGGGWSIRPAKHLLAYGFLDAGLSVDGRLQHDYAFGPGAEAGLLAQPTPRWKLKLNARYLEYRYGQPHGYTSLGLSQHYTLGRQQALRLDWRQQRAFGLRDTTLMAAWRWYL